MSIISTSSNLLKEDEFNKLQNSNLSIEIFEKSNEPIIRKYTGKEIPNWIIDKNILLVKDMTKYGGKTLDPMMKLSTPFPYSYSDMKPPIAILFLDSPSISQTFKVTTIGEYQLGFKCYGLQLGFQLEIHLNGEKQNIPMFDPYSMINVNKWKSINIPITIIKFENVILIKGNGIYLQQLVLFQTPIFSNYNLTQGTNYGGDSFLTYNKSTVKDCAIQCNNNSNCTGFVTDPQGENCWIKSGNDGIKSEPSKNTYKKLKSTSRNYKQNINTDYPGQGDIKEINGNLETCKNECDTTLNCSGFIIDNNNTHCWLKDKNISTPTFNENYNYYGSTDYIYDNYSKTDNVDYPGFEFRKGGGWNYNVEDCKNNCDYDSKCTGFTISKPVGANNSRGCSYKNNNKSTTVPDENFTYYAKKPVDNYSKTDNVDYPGYESANAGGWNYDVEDCKKSCDIDSKCIGFTISKPMGPNNSRSCSYKNNNKHTTVPNENYTYYAKKSVSKSVEPFDDVMIKNKFDDQLIIRPSNNTEKDTYERFDAVDSGYKKTPNVDYPGQGDMGEMGGNVQTCQTACDVKSNCTGFIINNDNTHCWLKDRNIPFPIYNANYSFYTKPQAPSRTYQMYPNTDYPLQGSITDIGSNAKNCQTVCDKTPNCTGFVMDNEDTHCWLKNNTVNTPIYDKKFKYYYSGTAQTDPPLSPNIQSTSPSSRIAINQFLSIDKTIYSDNKNYYALLQQDGNFVVYDNNDKPLWASNTTGKNSQTVIMQSDGNFCIYPITSNSVWCTMTNGKGGKFVSMDNDGVLRMYDSQNKIIWSSIVQFNVVPPELKISYNADFTYDKTTVPIYVLGNYGMAPWGTASFPDKTAQWIWSSLFANTNALKNTESIKIQYIYNNTTGVPLNGVLNIMIDNTASVNLNNKTIATNIQGGWGGNWPKVDFTVYPGNNLFEFSVQNDNGGPAGLLVSAITVSGTGPNSSSILFHSDLSWKFIPTPYTPITTCTLSQSELVILTDKYFPWGCLQLNGNPFQYLIVGTTITGMYGLSFGMWFRSNNNPNQTRLFDFGNGPKTDNIILSINSDTIGGTIFVTNIDNNQINFTQNINNNQWNHIVWTIEPTTTGAVWSVYLNNTLVYNKPGSYPINIARKNCYIGYKLITTSLILSRNNKLSK